MELPDYIPISMLNAFEYCPRRFWIEFVNAEMEINAHVLEGQIKHERAHTGSAQQAGDQLVLRRVYVYSDRLRLTGFVDVIEVDAASGEIVPVEYKKGSMGKWLNDHIQLCAQALCLEESFGRYAAGSPNPPIDYGFIFYFGSRRRERVEFNQALRDKTLASIQRLWALLEQGKMPAPIDTFAKCRECSLEPMCLPREVRQLAKS